MRNIFITLFVLLGNYAISQEDLPYFTNGQEKLLQKNYSGAIDDFTKGIAIYKDDDVAYFMRGVAFYFKGEYPSALSDFNKSILLNQSSNTGAYVYRGMTKCELNDFKGAITDYDKAIFIDPKMAKAITKRAEANAIILNVVGAINDYKKAIELDSKDVFSYCNLGLIYYKQENFPEALKYYNSAISIDPSFPYGYYLRARLFIKTKENTKANVDFNKVLNLQEIRQLKPFSLFYLGRKDDALSEMKNLVVDDPSIQNYYDLASLYSLLNSKDESIKYLKIAISKGYKDLTSLMNDEYFNNIKDSDEFKAVATTIN